MPLHAERVCPLQGASNFRDLGGYPAPAAPADHRRDDAGQGQRGLTAATVNKSLEHLGRLGVVSELTNRRRGRVFAHRRYVDELAAEPGRVA